MPLNNPITDWNGIRVWVIGASSGIGAALAQSLLAAGARVALSARNAEALAEVAGGARPGQVLVLPLDVTHEGQLSAALDSIDANWSGLDLAVILAGSHRSIRAWDLSAGEARFLVETNLIGAMNACAVVIPHLVRAGSGGIAVVSSVAGYGGLPTSLVYGATKAALINFAETLYLDLAPRGIGVYLVNPGFVKTPLTDKNEFRMPALISAEEAAREIIRGFAAGRFEIHFPKRFTLWFKFMKLLPYRLYFLAIHKFTGL
jgi:NAD(P)-dependent dehydrogenase (short-subunit alcohol dehydrogenase family)